MLPNLFAIWEEEYLNGLLSYFTNLESRSELPDVIISDFLTFAGLDIGAKYNIPVMISYPGFFHDPHEANNWTPAFMSGLSSHNMDSMYMRLKNKISQWIERALWYATALKSNAIRQKHGIPPMILLSISFWFIILLD
jgi:hypothetical protein